MKKISNVTMGKPVLSSQNIGTFSGKNVLSIPPQIKLSGETLKKSCHLGNITITSEKDLPPFSRITGKYTQTLGSNTATAVNKYTTISKILFFINVRILKNGFSSANQE